MNRILSTLVIAILFIACSEKPSAPAEQSTTTPTAAPASTEVNTNDFADLPASAVKQSYDDTPNVVSVKAGNDASGVYKDGKRNGSWIEYHPGGLVKSITSYVDGKKEGLYIELGNNGSLTKRFTYHNDMRHGEYKELNYGTVKEERVYQFDKLEGVVKIYYDNGKVMEEGNYKNGTRDGVSKWYDQNGNVSITYEYKNGELVKK